MSRERWVPGVETCRPGEQDAVVAGLHRRGCRIISLTTDNDGYYEYVDPDRSSRREWVADPQLYIAYECPPPTQEQIREAALAEKQVREARAAAERQRARDLQEAQHRNEERARQEQTAKVQARKKARIRRIQLGAAAAVAAIGVLIASFVTDAPGLFVLAFVLLAFIARYVVWGSAKL